LYDAYKTNLLIEHILSDNLHNVPVRAWPGMTAIPRLNFKK
jgi:hypothetical protein